MALIKCKKCGEEISDKSTKCVHCGYATEQSITHICPECGKEFDNIVCQNCGYSPNKKKETTNNTKTRRFNFIPLLISLVVGIITFIILSIPGGIGFINIISAFVMFVVSYLGLTGRLDDFNEYYDDVKASTDSDPYKRAMYRQMKNNNKK